MNNPISVRLERKSLEITLIIGGTWHISAKKPPEVQAAINACNDPTVKKITLKAENIGEWDSSLLVFLVRIVKSAKARQVTVEQDLPAGLNRLITLAFEVKEQQGAKREKREPGLLEEVGEKVTKLLPSICDILLFLGQVLKALFNFFLGRATMRRQDFVSCVHECSLQALPIVSITTLLFGLILAFVGAVQLTQFGAQI